MKKHYSLRSNRFYHIGNRLFNSYWFWLAVIIVLVASFNVCVYCFELVGGSVLQLQAKDVSTGCTIKAIMLECAIIFFLLTSLFKKRKH